MPHIRLCGIYKITSPSGRVYIGQSVNMFSRWCAHARSNKNHVLMQSIKKYGKDAHRFDIIQWLPLETNQDILNQYEHFYLELYRLFGFRIMNIKAAGHNGKISEETKRKISEANRGKKMPPDHAEKTRARRLGVKASDETKAKMSLASKGKPKHPDHGRKVSKAKMGKRYGTGAKRTEQQKTHLSNLNKRIIFNSETGIYYFGCLEALKTLDKKVHEQSFTAWMNGRRKNKTSFNYA